MKDVLCVPSAGAHHQPTKKSMMDTAEYPIRKNRSLGHMQIAVHRIYSESDAALEASKLRFSSEVLHLRVVRHAIGPAVSYPLLAAKDRCTTGEKDGFPKDEVEHPLPVLTFDPFSGEVFGNATHDEEDKVPQRSIPHRKL